MTMAADPYANLWKTDDLTFTEGDEGAGAGLSAFVLTSSSPEQSDQQQGAATGVAQAQTGVGGGNTGNFIADAIFAGVNIVQGQQAADAQAASLRKAAKNLYTEAAQTMRQGEYVAMTRGLDLEQRLGSLRTAVAASGVDSASGSIQAATNMTETFGRLDVQMERLNAARRAKGLREQAKAMEKQADFTEEQSFLGTTDIFGPFG